VQALNQRTPKSRRGRATALTSAGRAGRRPVTSRDALKIAPERRPHVVLDGAGAAGCRRLPGGSELRRIAASRRIPTITRTTYLLGQMLDRAAATRKWWTS